MVDLVQKDCNRDGCDCVAGSWNVVIMIRLVLCDRSCSILVSLQGMVVMGYGRTGSLPQLQTARS